MDPNLFHLDWERLAEVLAVIIVLSFLLERALALLFEHRWFIDRYYQRGLKEPIAFALAAAICWNRDFDALSIIIVSGETTTIPGKLITAAVIAGGSKASVKLFHDILSVKSTALKAEQGTDRIEIKTEEKTTTTVEASK